MKKSRVRAREGENTTLLTWGLSGVSAIVTTVFVAYLGSQL